MHVILVGPMGVVIKGAMVMINSGDAAGAGQAVALKPKLALTKPKEYKDPLA